MSICIIPARGGSKRIPRKNVKPFNGTPIIEVTIKKLLDFNFFNHIFVSTEDDEIAEVAKAAGAAIIERPNKLADDFTTTRQVIAHGIKAIDATDFSHVYCVYPTSVFIAKDNIKQGAYPLMKQRFAMTVTEYRHPPQRGLHVLENGSVMPQYPELVEHRTQDLTPVYHDAAQFYAGTATKWLSGDPIISNTTHGIIIPRNQAIDIDNPEDWELAEKLYAQS